MVRSNQTNHSALVYQSTLKTTHITTSTNILDLTTAYTPSPTFYPRLTSTSASDRFIPFFALSLSNSHPDSILYLMYSHRFDFVEIAYKLSTQSSKEKYTINYTIFHSE